MTFDFSMVAFPGYTYFDRAQKVIVDMTIVSGDTTGDTEVKHSTPVDHVGE